MLNLTRHEQQVLIVVLALVFLGIAARLYRGTHAGDTGSVAQPLLYATS